MIHRFRDQPLPALEFAQRAFDAIDAIHGDDFRLRDRDVKDLIEEIMPIAVFGKTFEAPERRLTIHYKGRDHPYDAEIGVSGASTDYGFVKAQYFLEVTTAVAPHEYLERESLRRYGFVFGGGDIQRNPVSREIISRVSVRDPDMAVKEVSARVNASVMSKAQKPYPSPCILLVFVQPDCRLTSSDWAYLVQQAAPQALQSPFEAVYLVETTAGSCYLAAS